MLCITVELLDDTIVAGTPDDIALTGAKDFGEWPPSPGRLFAAFVAADGTGERRRVTSGSELRALECAGAPTIVADPSRDVEITSQVPRYVPENDRAKGAVQEYVARKATMVRTAPRLAPRTPRLAYVWPDLDLGDEMLDALRLRAARVGYLGHATSSVRVTVHDRVSIDELGDWTRRWEPSETGRTELPVPFDGLIDVLDEMHAAFSAGEPTRRSWYASERARYRAPDQHAPLRRPPVEVVWLRLQGSLPGRHILHLTEALRGAVLTAYETHVAGSTGEVPAVLHGHGFDGPDYEHASWLGLPDVGHAYARGRIHGAAVVLPDDTPWQVLDGVRTALRAIDELQLPGGVGIGVSLYAGEPRPRAAQPRRWTGPSARWCSAFPVVHERFVRPQPDLDEIARWCEHAGFPAPAQARLVRVPLQPGAVSLMPHEARRSDDDRHPFDHLALRFDEPVQGPMALGHLRHFGLGLMLPMVDDEREAEGGHA